MDAESPEKPSLLRRIRLALYGAALNGGIGGIMALVKWLPYGRRQRAGVTIRRNVAYRDTGMKAHLLDIYRPREAEGPLPVVVYFHGGGFAYLSKDSHWLMGTLFANHGCVVVNANYRLAPKHRFPAAMEDAVSVLEWVGEHMDEIGGDPSRLVFAGESAGANLLLGLTLGTCWDREEPLSQRVQATGLVPRAIAPACGMLQVTGTERFADAGVPQWILDRMAQVSMSYLGPGRATGDVPLADPLVDSGQMEWCWSREYFRFAMGRIEWDVDVDSIEGLAQTLRDGATLADGFKAIAYLPQFKTLYKPPKAKAPGGTP